ncbi:MAG: zinc dependent phospholipase C family protein [Deltaproteobacteria bacterium]|nr:zinc dependent phospholipase C family protein [Deltaproteobacteria bacterium]
MKRMSSTRAFFIGVTLLGILAAGTSGFAWNQSYHAYVAKTCLGLEGRYIASYNARMGSTVPDFFWYLRDAGLIDEETAYRLHGNTEAECVSGETIYFYKIAQGLLEWWNYRLRYFTRGIRTHVYADIVAHNPYEGYVEGTNRWADTLETRTGEDRALLHLAAEFAADALLVQKYGLQLNDLLFTYRQGNFLERAIEEALGGEPEFDVSEEFRKYMALVRALEKAALLYAPYLIKGGVDEEALNQLEGSELLEEISTLSKESLGSYSEVLRILVEYPKEIYDTLTADGIHWEKDALRDAISFCKNPVICNE